MTVVEICGSGEEGAAQEHIGDVVRYLTRHRINGGARVIANQQGSGGAQLIKLTQDEGADLLVTGTYGHKPPRRMDLWRDDTGPACNNLDLLPDVSLTVAAPRRVMENGAKTGEPSAMHLAFLRAIGLLWSREYLCWLQA
ncbi:MAG: hypothetical protein ACR2KT_03785 [Methylocella sp.]|nr:MAG: hypothetical protein DLM68_03430 [Hyphomicrobiales bacterium]